MKKIFSLITIGAALLLSSLCVNSCQKAPKEIVELELTNVMTPTQLSGYVTSAGDVVSFDWNKSKGAEYFTLELYSDPEMLTLEKTVTVYPYELPILVKLDLDVKYYYRVRGCSDSIQPSKWAVFADEDGNPKPLKTYAVKSSANPVLVNRTESTITLSWELPEGDTELTHAVAVDTKGNEVEGEIEDLSAGVVTIEGLEPSTEYTVSLCYKSANRGSLNVWTRPATDGSETRVETVEALKQAITDGAEKIIVAYSEDPYVIGSMSVKGAFSIKGESDVNGVKPVIVGSFADAGLTSFHVEDIEFNGAATGEIVKQGSLLTAREGGEYSNIEFLNINIHDFAKGLYYDGKGAKITGAFLVDGIIESNIEGNGGENIDARETFDYESIIIRNSTFNGGCRSFLRADAKGKVGNIEVVNNTFNNLCANAEGKPLGSSQGYFYVRCTVGTFKVHKNLFLNNIYWLVSNASAALIPEFDKNYTFNCSKEFYNSTKDGKDRSDINKDIIVKGGGALTLDPCYNSADGIFNLKEATLVNSKIGDPRWYIGFIPQPEDLTIPVTAPVKTWNFKDPKTFKSPVETDMVRDGIRFYVQEVPMEFDSEKGYLLFPEATHMTSKGEPTDCAIAFKVNQPGSVVLSTVDNGRSNATLIVSLDGKPKAAAVVGSQGMKVVFDDIEQGEEKIITLYCTERIGLSFLQWSDEVDVTDTKFATPVVSADKTTVTMGDDEKVTLSWEAISKVGFYDVYCGVEKVASVTSTSYEISTKNFESGEYSYSVQAMPAETDLTHEASDMSEEVSFSVVEVLRKVSATAVTEWDATYMTAGVAKFGNGTELTSNFVYGNLGYLTGGSKFKFGIDNAESENPLPRVQLGGTGTPGTKCNIQIMVAGSGTLEIVARSGGDAARYVMVAVGSTVLSADGYEAVDKNQDPNTITVDVEAADGNIVNIYSKGSGINIYGIKWTPKSGPAPEVKDKTWDFAASDWQTELAKMGEAGKDISATWNITIDGLNYSASKSRWTTKCIQVTQDGRENGNGVFTFDAEAAGSVVVTASGTGSTPSGERYVALHTDGANEQISANCNVSSGGDPAVVTFNVSKGQQKIYVTSALRIYKIEYKVSK